MILNILRLTVCVFGKVLKAGLQWARVFVYFWEEGQSGQLWGSQICSIALADSVEKHYAWSSALFAEAEGVTNPSQLPEGPMMSHNHKKAQYLFKGALSLPRPSWFRPHTDTYWCGSMKLFTNFRCDRRVFALCLTFILGLWHVSCVATFSSVPVGKLFVWTFYFSTGLSGHAHANPSLQTMLLTQAPLLCCVCGFYIVYVVILFDLLVLFRCA